MGIEYSTKVLRATELSANREFQILLIRSTQIELTFFFLT